MAPESGTGTEGMARALRDSEARLRSVISSAPLVLWALDREGTFTFSEGKALEILGLHPGEAVGRSVFDVYADHPKVLEDARRALGGEEVTTVVEVAGSTFEVRYSPLRDEAGAPDGVIGVALDVTEQRQAMLEQQRRAAQSARFQEALIDLARTGAEALQPTLERLVRVDAETIGVERVSVWLFNEDGTELVCTTLHTLSEAPQPAPASLRADSLPHYFRALHEKRVIMAHDASADPATHEFAESYLRPLGITSMMDVPIWRHGRMVGVLCHEHVGPRRRWSFEEQDFAASVADMVSLALEASERRHAEETLRQRERQLAEAQALAHVGDWQWYVGTNEVSWSDELYRIYGFEPQSFTPDFESYLERVHPEDREVVQAQIEAVFESQAACEYEHRIVRRDGAIRVLHGRAEVVRGPDGRPERMWGTGQDVTEARQAEDALRASEQRAQAMAARMRAVAAAAAGVIGAQSLEALQEVLREACRRVIPFDAFTFALYDARQRTLTLLPGYDAGVYVPGETISAAGLPMERVVRERRSLLTLRADDPAAGGAIPMGTGRRSESIIRSPILSGERVLGAISVQSYTPDLYTPEDVEVLEAVASLAATALENLRLSAERQQAQEALRVSETRFRTIFEQFPLSLQIFSPDGQTLEVNQAWRDLFGVTPEKLGDFNPLHDPQLAELGGILRRGFAGETLVVPPALFDTSALAGSERAPGPRWIQAFICPVKNEDGSVREVFLIHQDVTPQQEAEQVLRRSHEELEQRVTERTAELARSNRALEEEVAERERAENELRQKTQELQAILQVLPDLYLRFDAGGAVLEAHAGPSFGKLAPPEFFLGKRPEELLPADAAEHFSRGLRQVAETGELVYFEYSLPTSVIDAWNTGHATPAGGAEGNGASAETALQPAEGTRDFEARLVPLHGDQVITIIRDITDRKEAERALQRSEEHFRLITENSSDVASILDARGVGVYHSPSVERVLGYPVEEVLGTSAFERIHPDDHQKCREALGAMFTHPGEDRNVEFRYLNGKKGWRVLEVIGRTLLPDSADAGVIINARDVTERKEAEEALRRSEERFRALIENGSDLITVVDAEGVIQYQSPSVTRVLGYDAATLLGRDAREFAHPDDAPDMVDMLEAAMNAPGTIRTVEFRFGHAGGSWRVFESIGRTLLADSASEGVVITSRDVTERKEAERALQEREEHFRRLIENAYDMVLVMDTAGTITYASPSAQRVLGSAPEELTGSSGFSLVHPDDVDTALASTTETVATPGAVVSAELRLRHRDGSYRILETFCRTVADDSAASGIVVNARDATERKHSEEQLRLQKTLLEAQGEASIDGILVVSPEGKMLSFNRRFVEMWGIPEAVVESASDEAAVQAVLDQLEDPQEFITRIAHLYEHRDEQSREEIRLRDGRIFDRYSAPVKSGEGDYYGRIWFFRDITERKHAEQAIRASEESYRGLFDALTELVYIQDLEGRFLNVNEAVVRTYGYSREELIGQPPDILADPTRVDVADTMARFRRAVAGEPQRFDWWGRRKDGSVFPKEVVLTPSTYFGQQVVIAVGRDVTERTQAEEALRESEQRFRTVVENASDLITVMAPDGTVQYESPVIERLLGYGQEELVGSNAFGLVHPDDLPGTAAAFERLLHEAGVTHRVEFRFRHKDGSWLPLEAVGTAQPAGDGVRSIIVNSRDITERKRIMAALETAKEEAERANRAKSEFLSRMSHELRTPMNSILGFAQLLERKPLEARDRTAVDHILKAGRHLLNLINEVLDIARIEANRQHLSLEPVQVDIAVQEALSLIRPLAAQRDCRLVDCVALPDLYVRADRQRLTQVLLNLLSNAVKYNRPGGTVCMIWETVEEADAPGRLRLGVRDTGPGIAPEKQEHLFVPFERLGAEQSGVEGTGLGLALSKRLVEAMGGDLSFESVPGEGSTFWVELALEASPLERLGQAESAAPLAGGEREAATLLYIEDNLANLTLIETILADRPEITLVPALQGQMGLELACEHRPDLILLDLHLPDIRGDEVLRRLQADGRTRETPVVVISADATERRVERLRAAGAHAYLTKPIDVREFLETVDRILAERRAVGGSAQ